MIICRLHPTAIALGAYGCMIYVANSHDNTVSVIDVDNNTKIKGIPVGKGSQPLYKHLITFIFWMSTDTLTTMQIVWRQSFQVLVYSM